LGNAVKKRNQKSSRSTSNLSKRHRQRRRSRDLRVEKLEARDLLAADLSAPAVEGELAVLFEPGTSVPLMNLIATQNGGEIVRTFKHLNMAHFRMTGGGDGGSDAGQVTHSLIDDLESYPQVNLVEPNYVSQPLRYIPNDTFLGEQWGIDNNGSVGPGGFAGVLGADIDGFAAWEIGIGSPDVVIAVIDTGQVISHPDLFENLWTNDGEIPNNGIDDDDNGYIDDYFGFDFVNNTLDLTDKSPHGVHVSGTVAAIGDNNEGVTGVAWGAKIMSLKAGDPAFISTALLGAYNYMLDQLSKGVNIVVSNNSYGGAARDGIVEIAIQATTDAGILFVAASGNDGQDNDGIEHFPSGYANPLIISVGATDRSDLPAIFTNYGETTVDLHAPGVDIASTLRPQDGYYDYQSGTSMASPHVAGAIGVLAAINPDATAAQLKAYILQGVDVLDSLRNDSVTGGRLNLMGAIDAMPRGDVMGTVFDDVNENGQQDPGEFGIGGVRIILDRDFDGVEDEIGEWSVITDSSGGYTIPNYWHTDFQLVIELPILLPGPFETPDPIIVPGPPRGDDIDIDIPIQRGQPGEISGIVFNDINQDGVQQPAQLNVFGDRGVGGVVVFLDVNNDDLIQLSEPSTVTAADGSFNLAVSIASVDLEPGPFNVRIITPPGWMRSSPTNGERSIELGGGLAPITGLDFGMYGGDQFDFGDKGNNNSLADNGPRHGVIPGFQLGAENTAEVDALESDTGDDGIVITSNVFAGGTVTADVTVSLGGMRPGYLHGWIDVNNDGNFDASEKVINNVRLMEGTTAVSFVLPANTLTGPRMARFRYGWEYNMGAYGPALAGEVEDMTINVFGDNPIANDDPFSVDQDSSNNNLDVLGNDFPSSSGGLYVQAINTSSTSGTVAIAADQLSVIYTPRPLFSGTDTFTYTVQDLSGSQSTATVTVTVIPTFANPVAIDDQELVPLNSPGTVINVLQNDLSGSSGPLRISGTGTASNGGVSIDNQGTPDPTDDVLVYVPGSNYQGIDQFTYDVVDQVGSTSSAVVTVYVGDSTSDDLIRYFIEFTTLAGSPISGNQVTIGTEYMVNVFVQDIRPVTGGLSEDDHGIFAAYLDVLYPAGSTSLTGPLVFDGSFQSIPEGDVLTPGIINEAGAFQNVTSEPPGLGPQLVFRVPFRANSLGVITYTPNISDEIVDPGPPLVGGDHDTLVWAPTPAPVFPNDISFLANTITVIASGEPIQNINNPVDVNDDGNVNPFDALLVINAIQQDYRGQGESAGFNRSTSNYSYTDVNGDHRNSIHDVLPVLEHLRRKAMGQGEAPGGDILSVRPAAGVDFTGVGSRENVISDSPARDESVVGSSSAAVVVGSTDTDEDVALREYLDDSVVDGDDEFFAEILGNWTE
jgi:subtilisin family serine protease